MVAMRVPINTDKFKPAIMITTPSNPIMLFTNNGKEFSKNSTNSCIMLKRAVLTEEFLSASLESVFSPINRYTLAKNLESKTLLPAPTISVTIPRTPSNMTPVESSFNASSIAKPMNKGNNIVKQASSRIRKNYFFILIS